MHAAESVCRLSSPLSPINSLNSLGSWETSAVVAVCDRGSSHEGRSRTASPCNKAVTRYCVGGRVYLSRGPRDESRSTGQHARTHRALRTHDTAGRVCKSRTPGRCAAMSVSSGGGARSEMGLRVSGSRFMEKNAQEWIAQRAHAPAHICTRCYASKPAE